MSEYEEHIPKLRSLRVHKKLRSVHVVEGPKYCVYGVRGKEYVKLMVGVESRKTEKDSAKGLQRKLQPLA